MAQLYGRWEYQATPASIHYFVVETLVIGETIGETFVVEIYIYTYLYTVGETFVVGETCIYTYLYVIGRRDFRGWRDFRDRQRESYHWQPKPTSTTWHYRGA